MERYKTEITIILLIVLFVVCVREIAICDSKKSTSAQDAIYKGDKVMFSDKSFYANCSHIFVAVQQGTGTRYYYIAPLYKENYDISTCPDPDGTLFYYIRELIKVKDRK